MTCDPLEIGHFPYEKEGKAWQKFGVAEKEKPATDESEGRLLYCLSDRAREGFAASLGFRKSTRARKFYITSR